MKKISTMVVLAALSFGCRHYEDIVSPTNAPSADDEEQEVVTDQLATWDFPEASQTALEAARASYQGKGVPAVIIYVHEADSPTRDHRSVLTTDVADCELSADERSTNEEGFTFIAADELCGEGAYEVDLRQGGYYDSFCGPGSVSFTYEGSPVWVEVETWCE